MRSPEYASSLCAIRNGFIFSKSLKSGSSMLLVHARVPGSSLKASRFGALYHGVHIASEPAHPKQFFCVFLEGRSRVGGRQDAPTVTLSPRRSPCDAEDPPWLSVKLS